MKPPPLLRQNTELTTLTRDLTEQIARLTHDVHEKLTRDRHVKPTALNTVYRSEEETPIDCMPT